MFRKINAGELPENAVSLFNEKWGLLTAGKDGAYNTMTISWGALGELWGKDVCTVYVRPERYTYGFMEKNDEFTVSFFGSEYRSALSFCGSRSGRDCDKAAQTGLTPITVGEATAFEQAEIILRCRKLYSAVFEKDKFIDKDIEKNIYDGNGYHRMYVGEILEVLVRD